MTEHILSPSGQITFARDVLAHLGLQPGDKLEIDLLPNGRAQLRAVREQQGVGAFFGLLAGKTNGRRLSPEDMRTVVTEAVNEAYKP